MTHAQNILALLDAQRCSVCGQKAVRGSTVCLACAGREPAIGSNAKGVVSARTDAADAYRVAVNGSTATR